MCKVSKNVWRIMNIQIIFEFHRLVSSFHVEFLHFNFIHLRDVILLYKFLTSPPNIFWFLGCIWCQVEVMWPIWGTCWLCICLQKLNVDLSKHFYRIHHCCGLITTWRARWRLRFLHLENSSWHSSQEKILKLLVNNKITAQ